MEIVADLVKIIVPSALVVYGMFVVVQAFIKKQTDEKRLEIKSKVIDVALPLQLQAYERLLLFLERISPNQLLIRVQPRSVQTSDFLQLLLLDIREEYNHNIAQQLYVSHAGWEKLTAAKDNLVALVQVAAREVSADAPAIELSKKIMEKTLALEGPATAEAIKYLKAEAQELFR